MTLRRHTSAAFVFCGGHPRRASVAAAAPPQLHGVLRRAADAFFEAAKTSYAGCDTAAAADNFAAGKATAETNPRAELPACIFAAWLAAIPEGAMGGCEEALMSAKTSLHRTDACRARPHLWPPTELPYMRTLTTTCLRALVFRRAPIRAFGL